MASNLGWRQLQTWIIVTGSDSHNVGHVYAPRHTKFTVLNFEESLKLKSTGQDRFENVHQPWTWPGTSTVPGGLLISECATAAYATIDASVFVLDNVQSQFLSATKPSVPITYAVQRISNGRRFAVRFVTGSQNGRNVICATICFSNLAADKNNTTLRYKVERETPQHIKNITLDDLEPKTPLGSFMKFQRLGVHSPPQGTNTVSSSSSIVNKVAVIACHISSDLSNRPPGHMSHILGLLNLSDYHVLDCPPTLADVSVGQFAVGDESRTPRESAFTLFTSLNHSVWFHKHDGFRADEMCYVEAKSSWAHTDGRAFVDTRIFDKDDELIATVSQEAFFVFKDSQKDVPSKVQKGKL